MTAASGALDAPQLFDMLLMGALLFALGGFMACIVGVGRLFDRYDREAPVTWRAPGVLWPQQVVKRTPQVEPFNCALPGCGTCGPRARAALEKSREAKTRADA